MNDQQNTQQPAQPAPVRSAGSGLPGVVFDAIDALVLSWSRNGQHPWVRNARIEARNGLHQAIRDALAQAAKPDERALAAIRTMERMGYTYTGGAQWRPPIGKTPERIAHEPGSETHQLAVIIDAHERARSADLGPGTTSWARAIMRALAAKGLRA